MVVNGLYDPDDQQHGNARRQRLPEPKVPPQALVESKERAINGLKVRRLWSCRVVVNNLLFLELSIAFFPLDG